MKIRVYFRDSSRVFPPDQGEKSRSQDDSEKSDFRTVQMRIGETIRIIPRANPRIVLIIKKIGVFLAGRSNPVSIAPKMAAIAAARPR